MKSPCHRTSTRAGPDDSASVAPPLGPALAAMTGLQALVALGIFAPGVLAPRLGLKADDLGLFATAVFTTGAVTAIGGGWAAGRFGSFGIAALCAASIALGMGAASVGTAPAMLLAGCLVGVAFGPETPASSALLGRLATGPRAPFVFSVRQTGNQLGAMTGSLVLPWIALGPEPALGYGLVALAALVSGSAFLVLRPRYDGLTVGHRRPLDVVGSLRLLGEHPALRRLALASMPWSALQLALNAFFVTFAVDRLALTHVTAGLLLATAQCAGLVGRLGWGAVAIRIGAGRVMAGLGLAMGAAALGMAATPSDGPFPVLIGVVALLGITASGWNGVFLAEVARSAPRDRIAEATGAVLLASYTGLVLGPAAMTGLASFGSLASGYAVLGGLSAVAGFALLWHRPVP